jgi:PPP family 3-phenylpropionic acid transporter
MTESSAPAPAPPRFAPGVSIFFGGYFLVQGVVLPFFPVWLAGRGLSEVEIGSVIAIPLALRVLLTPFGGMIADALPNRRFAVVLFTLPAPFLFAAAWPLSGYLPLLVVTGLAFIVWGLALPAGEALALTGVRRFGLDYGRMRVWGSLSFIAANLAAGALLAVLPRESIFGFIVATLVLSALGALLLPVTPRAVRALDDALTAARRPAWFALARPSFLLLILAAGLITASHAAFNGFGSIYWEGLGFTPLQIGGFWAVSIVGEVCFFTWSSAFVDRFGPLGLIALGAFAAIVRWFAMSFDLGVAGFAAIQVLHALTFAAVLLGTQLAITRSMPESAAASAQGMVAFVAGLLMSGLTALSGSLFAALGAHTFLFMIVPPALALVVLLVLRRMPPGEEGGEAASPNEKGAAEAAP